MWFYDGLPKTASKKGMCDHTKLYSGCADRDSNPGLGVGNA